MMTGAFFVPVGLVGGQSVANHRKLSLNQVFTLYSDCYKKSYNNKGYKYCKNFLFHDFLPLRFGVD